jgi:hypothetical protein
MIQELQKTTVCHICVTDLNCGNVIFFFFNLMDLKPKHEFSADRNCNSGETGNTVVHVPSKIICARAIKQVGNLISVSLLMRNTLEYVKLCYA